jgi:hypothetical protein
MKAGRRFWVRPHVESRGNSCNLRQ